MKKHKCVFLSREEATRIANKKRSEGWQVDIKIQGDKFKVIWWKGRKVK